MLNKYNVKILCRNEDYELILQKISEEQHFEVIYVSLNLNPNHMASVKMQENSWLF